MSKIYDCFCFFNELDILELRLNILNDVVDYFVISESSVTHTGQPKPYYFEENKERYSKFLHKIIHLKIEDTPNNFLNLPPITDTESFDGKCLTDIHHYIKRDNRYFNRATEIHYGRDFYQKECVRRGLYNCNDEDIIISSDCDEIPNPEVLKDIQTIVEEGKFYMFNQNSYYYYVNIFKEGNWFGSRAGRYKDLKNYSYNELRNTPQNQIANGGWHFSFMGGADKVKTKIQSYSAQELNNPHVLNSISNNMNSLIDPFFRGNLSMVPMDETYPKYLLQNINTYNHLIKA